MAAALAAADRAALIDPAELASLLGRLETAQTDEERLRILKAVARNASFECQMAAVLVAPMKYSPVGAVEAMVLMCARIVDPSNVEQALAGLHYKEQRADVRRRLGLFAFVEPSIPDATKNGCGPPPPGGRGQCGPPPPGGRGGQGGAPPPRPPVAAAPLAPEPAPAPPLLASDAALEGFAKDALAAVRVARDAAVDSVGATGNFSAAPTAHAAAPAVPAVPAGRPEDALDEIGFAAALGVDRAAFAALPAWRQTALRKKAGLF
ncbi:hypothetical protein M885DRAFT_620647 [Pelagophyceae sp. CCMP2097]|nr:hypothetical protein M885DRAFT_620647 [Pelagophyceae sp. CCMP2097]